MSERTVAEAGLFDARAVARLWKKCREVPAGAQLSNSDNMAVVGVLSTGLLYDQFVRRQPDRESPGEFRTVVDRLTPRGAAGGQICEAWREVYDMTVQERVRQFIIENFYVADASELGGASSLIQGGWVDSTGMLGSSPSSRWSSDYGSATPK